MIAVFSDVNTDAILGAAIVLFSILGFAVSLFFTLVYFQFMKADHPFIPSFCRIDEGTCRQILHTRDARLLGIPNFLLGLLYYTGLILYVLMGEQITFGVAALVVLSASTSTVIVGLYLVHSLLSKLRVHCTLCYISHALNAALFCALMIKEMQ